MLVGVFLAACAMAIYLLALPVHRVRAGEGGATQCRCLLPGGEA
jgi:hypothetical protein